MALLRARKLTTLAIRVFGTNSPFALLASVSFIVLAQANAGFLANGPTPPQQAASVTFADIFVELDTA